MNGSDSAAPVNAAWTFWKEDDSLSHLSSSSYTGPWYDNYPAGLEGPTMAEIFSFQYVALPLNPTENSNNPSLFSPKAVNNTNHDIQIFPFKISAAHDDHYNVSAKVKNATFLNSGFFRVDGCSGPPGIQNAYIDGSSSPATANFGFEFDRHTLNASFELPQAYISLSNMAAMGFYGNLKVTLTGAKVDTWHSDTLVGGASPSWNSTVGYDQKYWGYNPQNTTVDSNGAVNKLSYSGVLSAVLAGFGSATFLLI